MVPITMLKHLALLLGLFLIPFVQSAGAASVTIDLTGAGANGGGYGNSLSFADGGVSVDVSSYGETGAEAPPGSSYYLFQQAEVYSWGTGIGSCNQSEGTVGSGCSSNEHEVDTVGRDDLVAFVFDQVVNFEYLTVDPYNGPGSDPNDRDIIYWVGNSASLPSLTTETFDTLDLMAGFSGETQSAASSSYNPYTHSLSGIGNILLLSGDYHDLYCKNRNVSNDIECEAYKISNITVSAVTAVPLPAAAWLFGSALLGLLGIKRGRS